MAAAASSRRCIVVVLALAAALLLSACCAEGAAAAGGKESTPRRRQLHRQRQVQYHLRRLNKAPVASIESPDGDIIDCVPISSQPAFDHPFLKDHIIQTRPAYHPEGLYDESKVASQKNTQTITQMWHQNGRCQENTIPIRRTKKEDVLRASSLKRYCITVHTYSGSGLLYKNWNTEAFIWRFVQGWSRWRKRFLPNMGGSIVCGLNHLHHRRF